VGENSKKQTNEGEKERRRRILGIGGSEP